MDGLIDFIFRADDIGYCESVNYGIEKTVRSGIIKSVGLMPNMPAAEHGLKLIRGTGVCIGQHTNICVGRPCANPLKIPSMVDSYGMFLTSSVYRNAYKDGKDLVNVEEAIIEIEAQYHKFKELTGQEPGYFEAHAIMSDNLFKALEIVAQKYGLKYNKMTLDGSLGVFNKKYIANCVMKSGMKNYDPFLALKDAVRNAYEDIPNVFICHPGYLDQFILTHSSLTINRTKEVQMLCDPKTKEWIISQNIRLISYDDIS